MPRVLKDENREAIIRAARAEFLKNGYRSASMRRIADNAGMTVGNLYHYFRNKSEILRYIVSGTYEKMTELFENYSLDKVEKKAGVYGMQTDTAALNDNMDEFIDELYSLYSENKEEFSILLLNSEVNRSMYLFFYEIFSAACVIEDRRKNALIDAYVNGYIRSIRTLFADDSEDLHKLLRMHLESIMFMLENYRIS